MKVLITGGAGFIGSHLALKLLEQGKQVVLLDNFHSYYAKSRKQFQLEQVQRSGNVPFYECDILHKEDVKAVMQQEKVDAVIHLAGFPGVRPSLEMPGAYIDINIKGTSNVLTCAGEENVKNHCGILFFCVWRANRNAFERGNGKRQCLISLCSIEVRDGVTLPCLSIYVWISNEYFTILYRIWSVGAP